MIGLIRPLRVGYSYSKSLPTHYVIRRRRRSTANSRLTDIRLSSDFTIRRRAMRQARCGHLGHCNGPRQVKHDRSDPAHTRKPCSLASRTKQIHIAPQNHTLLWATGHLPSSQTGSPRSPTKCCERRFAPTQPCQNNPNASC